MPKECMYCSKVSDCDFQKEKRATYATMLRDVRRKHAERTRTNGTFTDINSQDGGSYFNGWKEIVSLVNKTLGPAKIIAEMDREDMAIDFAKKLSDLYVEYRMKRDGELLYDVSLRKEN